MKKVLETEKLKHDNQLCEEEGFRQLDLLYKAYKHDNQRAILLEKLHKLQKNIKKKSNENLSVKFKALKAVSDEIVQKKKIILSQIEVSYNFFELSNQIKKLKQCISHLNKAIRRKEIDANTHRITRSYYEGQLRLQFGNLNKLKRLAKEYIIILKNQELQLRAEERFMKSNISEKLPHIFNNKNVSINNGLKQNDIREVLDFLTKYILNYSP